jgi:hypothetical protein
VNGVSGEGPAAVAVMARVLAAGPFRGHVEL